jgi:hypothetical protein
MENGLRVNNICLCNVCKEWGGWGNEAAQPRSKFTEISNRHRSGGGYCLPHDVCLSWGGWGAILYQSYIYLGLQKGK